MTDYRSSASDSSSVYSYSSPSASRAASPEQILRALPTQTITRLDDKVIKSFESLLCRWRRGEQTNEDKAMLQQWTLSFSDYTNLTDQFNVSHGIELKHNKIILYETASEVHEFLGGVFDDWVVSVYGQHLVKLRSASILYNASSAKQPDGSFRPRELPAPNRQNQLRHQPGTFKPYPSFIFEIAVSNEDRERLLTDAHEKYFSETTSVQLWFGIKLDVTNNLFWAGWGRRSLTGAGLRLMEQTENEASIATYLPVYPYPQVALAGEFSMPSSLIFHPLSLPAGIPLNFVVTLEQIRSKLEEGIDLMG